MIRYVDFKKMVEETNRIYEHGIDKDISIRIKRLMNAGDYSSILKEANDIIKKIIEDIKNLNYDDLNFFITEPDIVELEIKYPAKINVNIDNLSNLLAVSDEKIYDYIFKGGYRGFDMDIRIDKNYLNKLDILNSLPAFMKGLGLGKKIYKKLIKNYEYLSSFKGFEPSIESDMVWNKITEDKEIYTFINGENFISFWNEVEFDKIIEVLKEFFIKPNEQIILDSDFIVKYDITNTFLNELKTLN
jgi:hypothetical protein